MTDSHGYTGRLLTAIAMSMLTGAGGSYLYLRERPVGSTPPPAQQPSTSTAQPATSNTAEMKRETPAGASAHPSDVQVTLTKEAVARAGIVLQQVSASTVAGRIVVPGLVSPNEYRQVAVTSLVAGRVTAVSAQLGDRVRKGQPLVQVYSPQIAEAKAEFVSAKSMLDAHEHELARTEKLVEIGAASRQELERAHAEHAAQTAAVESARSRLQLLGVAADAAAPAQTPDEATATVVAPADGIVIERLANTGANIDPSMKLLTVADLSTVWIVGDVYERDLSRVIQGRTVSVALQAYPGRSWTGRVSYISPQIDPATRTAKVRIVLQNSGGELTLGMYATVTIESDVAVAALTIPKEAIQTIGSREVVYLAAAADATTFVERKVRSGRVAGDEVEIVEGLTAGDWVVTNGSFFVRAEVERLGLRTPQETK